MFLTCKTPTSCIATFLPSAATVSSCDAITHSLLKGLSSHLIQPCRPAEPKDSKDREDDDTSRSRLLLMLDLLVHRAIARQAKATDLSEPQSLVITQSEQGALSECESLTTSCSSTLTSRSKAPRQDRTDPSPADTALFQQIFTESSRH